MYIYTYRYVLQCKKQDKNAPPVCILSLLSIIYHMEQQHRTAMQQWIQNSPTQKRNRNTIIRDDTPEPNRSQIIKDLIHNMRGTVIPIHGDGACWFRAIAKACDKTPMQIIADLENGIREHKHRRNRTDGIFIEY